MPVRLWKLVAMQLTSFVILTASLLAAQEEPVYRGSDFWFGYQNPERLISLFHGTFEGDSKDLYFRRSLVAYATLYDAFCRKSLPGKVVLFVDGKEIDAEIGSADLDRAANFDLLKKTHPELVIVDQRFADLYGEYYTFLETAELAISLGTAAKYRLSPWWDKPRFHMKRLFEQVPCTSVEIRQLGENILRIGRGQTRLTPPGFDEKVRAERLSVVDPTTGLVWTRRDTGFTVNYDRADEYCRNLEIDGEKSWRLPTIEQLEHLHDYKSPGHSCKGATCYVRLGIKLSDREVLSSSGVAIRFDHGNRYQYGQRGVALCVRGSES